MNTFVIFDRKTGQVLQVHTQSDGLRGRSEELLRTARPEANPEAVDVLEVESLIPGVSYRVDVKTRKLIQAEDDAVGGAAGASLKPIGGDPSTARPVIFQSGT